MKWSDMRETLLVTGSAGFIGSRFCKLAIGRGYKIVGLDAYTYAADINNINKLDKKMFTNIKGNILDYELVKELSIKHGVKTIVNFAAESHVDRSISDVAPFTESNVLGVINLLEVSKDLDLRLVHISTDEVYGSVEQVSNAKTTLVNPGNPYSASKAAAENFIMAYHNTHKIKATITRCSNNYGPHQNKEKFIPKTIESLFLGKPIVLYGDGSQVRSWLYVDDHCASILKVLENWKSYDVLEIHDFGGVERTNLEMINELARVAEISDFTINFVEDRKGHDQKYSMPNTSRTSLNQGLRETLDWYTKNI